MNNSKVPFGANVWWAGGIDLSPRLVRPDEIPRERSEGGIGYYMHGHALHEFEGQEREDYMSALLLDTRA